jgi:predicted membrane GTPase involved in stress response
MEFLREDEAIEVTPSAVRLRKAVLARVDRTKAARRARASAGVS